MSRSSAAKKSRRKRRGSARNEGRLLPADVRDDVNGIARIEDKIIPRGWEFDPHFSTGEFVTWYYPPSGVEVDEERDESAESVTRIWLTDPEEPHVILVGSTEDAADVGLTVEALFARLGEIE